MIAIRFMISIFLNLYIFPLWKAPILTVTIISILATLFTSHESFDWLVFFFIGLTTNMLFAFAFHQSAGVENIKHALKFAEESDCTFDLYKANDYMSNTYISSANHVGLKQDQINSVLKITPWLSKIWLERINILCPVSNDKSKKLLAFTTFSGGLESYIFISDPPHRNTRHFQQFLMAHELSHSSMTEDIILQRDDFNTKNLYISFIWILANSSFSIIILVMTLLSYSALRSISNRYWSKRKSHRRLYFEILADSNALDVVTTECLHFLKSFTSKYKINDSNMTVEENVERNNYFVKMLDAKIAGDKISPADDTDLKSVIFSMTPNIMLTLFFVTISAAHMTKISTGNLILDTFIMAYGFLYFFLFSIKKSKYEREMELLMNGGKSISN